VNFNVSCYQKRKITHYLKGKVAIVTGASRGGGCSIALVLSEEGVTVYVTRRNA